MLVDTQDFAAAVTEKEHVGRPNKLGPTYPGLVTAAQAMNLGVFPMQATVLCNMINSREMATPVRICKNTLLATLKKCTTVKQQ